MARKWHTFQRAVESFFLRLIHLWVGLFRRSGYRLLVLLVLGIFLSARISPVLSQMPVNQSQKAAEELVEEGKNYYENGKVSEAVNSLQLAVEKFKTRKDWNNLAITSTNLSRIFQELGQYTRACNTLVSAIGFDLQFCQDREFIQKDLDVFSATFQQLPEHIQVPVWRSLGDVLRAIGRLEESKIVLNKGLSLTGKLPNAQAATKLSLGNTYRAWGNLERDRQAEPKYEDIPWRCEEISLPEEALKHYEQADLQYQQAIKNGDRSIHERLRIKAKLNRLSLLLERGKWQEANDLSSEINIKDLPPGQSRVYARINYAKSLACLQQQKDLQAKHSWKDITQQIYAAIQESKNLERERELEDRHLLSYAIGNLGGLYEYLDWIEPKPEVPEFKELCQKEQEFSKKAQCLTQEALYRAQPKKAPDIAYQWQWQQGRLFKAEGNNEKAIASYEAAVETLESVRGDLLTINSDVQFNFRDNVEPLYRELVALLLPVGEKNPPQENLKKALYYVDSLQLAELENFLRCNLQGNIETVQLQRISKPNQRIQELFKGIERILDNYPTTAAFIYPIVLQEKISVILKLPGKDRQLQYHQTEVEQESLKKTLEKARATLHNKARITSNQKEPLQQLYQWIIGKFETDLKQEEIENLIFVPDNYFRTIPMSALFDGERFIVEKEYATTVVPGVQLLRYGSSEPLQLTALLVGAIEDRRPNFSDIQEPVNKQINSILENLTDSQILSQGEFEKETLGKFTKETLQKELRKSFYTIIHMVTHGQFSSNPEQTYILTDDKAEDINNIDLYSLNINELVSLLQTRDQSRPIELFFLSSCSTAKGDNRAVLGIAGVAVKSGARGTIAPLWDVDTISSRITIKEFYENLAKKQVSKAEALRLAQNSLRKNGYSPYHWAPFVLVGS